MWTSFRKGVATFHLHTSLFTGTVAKPIRLQSIHTMSNTVRGVHLQAAPRSTLMDEVVSIRVSDLHSGQQVTLVTRLQEGGKRFLGHAWYTADNQGVVDLKTAESSGGTYTGVEPMGLFWSMLPEPNQKPGLRLMKMNVTTPLEVELLVYHGHFDAMNMQNMDAQMPLAKAVLERWYLGKNVERTEVRDNGLVGTFFIPKDGSNYPGVLDLFGTIGVLLEHRSALLASRGFATFSLLPYNADKKIVTDLVYFEKAVEFILSHPRVSKHGVGVVGVSKGAETALLTAIISPKVKAVICISGTYFINIVDHTYHGEVFPGTTITSNNLDTNRNEEGMVTHVNRDMTKEELERTSIPVERTNAHILLVLGTEDQFSKPNDAVEYIPRRMGLHGKADKCHVLIYPGAGHLLEPPISAVCTQSYHSLYKIMVLWGGEPKAHAHAQEDFWIQMQDFLRKYLLPVGHPTDSKL